MVLAMIPAKVLLGPLLLMAAMGGILALILAFASKRFHVQVDPRIESILSILPGANCGACGYPGCAGYAEAIVKKGASIDLCAPGASACVAAIGKIMGVEGVAKEPHVATVRCNGDGVRQRFYYDGIRDCKAAMVLGLAGSFQACRFGCLGLGSCARACPFDAITILNGLPYIDESRCTGCKKCVATCPRGLLRVDPLNRTIFVRCANLEKGAIANKACNHACIACGKCARECPFQAISIVNNLAVIDYEKCKLCGKCVKVCPKQCIHNYRPERQARIALEKSPAVPA